MSKRKKRGGRQPLHAGGWGEGVRQEVLLQGQIAEGWQAVGFAELYVFLNKIKVRRSRGLPGRGGRRWDAWVKAELRALAAPGRGKAVWATSWGRYHFRPGVSRVAWLFSWTLQMASPCPHSVRNEDSGGKLHGDFLFIHLNHTELPPL